MPEQTRVSPQITDAVTQANVTVLGNGPAVSTVQAQMSLAQAQGVLFANMVNNQQQLAIAGHASMVGGVLKLLGAGSGKGENNQNNVSDAVTSELSELAASLKQALKQGWG